MSSQAQLVNNNRQVPKEIPKLIMFHLPSYRFPYLPHLLTTLLWKDLRKDANWISALKILFGLMPINSPIECLKYYRMVRVTCTTVCVNVCEYALVLLFTIYSYFEFLCKRLVTGQVKSLKNEIILVTGSGRGIGREICLELAKTGAVVVCWSKSPGPNEEVVSKIRERGGKAYAYSVDVSCRDEVEKMAVRVRREVGEVTIVINNAGLMRILPFLETPPDEIESMFKVNVLSNFWVLRAFLPGMIERGRGHIVSVCSACGILPTRYIVPYSGTKHAVHGYMDALRDEILHHPQQPKINFTTAYPFYCRTEMLDGGVPHSRFPYLFPIVTPELVAVKLVEGICRELDYIYIPALIGWLAMFSWLVTPKAITAHGDFLEVHIDPLEKKNR